MKNRFMLAPLTNMQSHADGRLSDDEFHWLTMRATGGFGLTMTCAAHVQARGQGFGGQLGVFGAEHVDGLTRLAAGIHKRDSVAVVQLHHAGIRAPAELIGEVPVGPSNDEETGARALSEAEVDALANDFIEAACRTEQAGFDGVEIHGAHGYIICAFLSPEVNRRTDRYGGSLENRARLLFDVVDGIRARCRPDFNVGVRLSPERFGLALMEIQEIAARLLSDAKIDYLDMSLWDVFKNPVEEAYKDRSLLSFFTSLPRGDVRLGVAGKIRDSNTVSLLMDEGVDFALIGRAAILHHDFAARAMADPGFEATSLPVSADYLRGEGLGPAFVKYMSGWKGFVTEG